MPFGPVVGALAVLLLVAPAHAAPRKGAAAPPAPPPPVGRYLSDLAWTAAAPHLEPDDVVVIPLGAGAKEHGPHLPLDADYRQATWITARLVERLDVTVAPPLTYGTYPAFVEYPGSTNVASSVARDHLVEVVRSLAHHGPRRFYVVNIGISTNKPLAEARELLALDGIALAWLDLTGPAVAALEHTVETQPEGTHADEIETSLLLAIDPSVVDMSKAVKELGPGNKARKGPFSPDPAATGASPSGIYGDATLATAEKGRVLLAGMVDIAATQIQALRDAPPPKPADLFGAVGPTPVPWSPVSAGARLARPAPPPPAPPPPAPAPAAPASTPPAPAGSGK